MRHVHDVHVSIGSVTCNHTAPYQCARHWQSEITLTINNWQHTIHVCNRLGNQTTTKHAKLRWNIYVLMTAYYLFEIIVLSFCLAYIISVCCSYIHRHAPGKLTLSLILNAQQSCQLSYHHMHLYSTYKSKPVLKDHCHEKPPAFKDRYESQDGTCQAERSPFHYNYNSI